MLTIIFLEKWYEFMDFYRKHLEVSWKKRIFAKF